MTNLSSVFDRSGAVQRPTFSRLMSEYRAVLTAQPTRPAHEALPSGDGAVVLVIPGFLISDDYVAPFRDYLDALGFRTFGWGCGRNWGPTERARTHLRRRAEELATLNGGPIAVVGISLGGLFARDLAFDCPGLIRHVVTLASPVSLPTASSFEILIRALSPLYSTRLEVDRLALPLPVPSTAFFTPDDGVVAWETCRSDDPGCTNIEVAGPHMTICVNPAVLSRLVPILAGEVPSRPV
jgi:pimeloyl-ACP methyl ester carboxylesterase